MTTDKIITLHSKIDATVNTYINGFETRFVERDDALIIYLSSFKGCDQACRMCHLTQQKQTDTTPASLEDFIKQAEFSIKNAVDHYKTSGKPYPEKVHFNFMARGEPLLNPQIREDFDSLAEALILALVNNADIPGVEVRFKISTIMTGIYTRDAHGTIVEGWTKLPFKNHLPDIYYSLYSVDDNWRKRWLPKAETPHEALRLLASYASAGGRVVFHSPFIHAENDDLRDIAEMVKAISFFALNKEFNIVRFNTFDADKYEESPEEHLLSIKTFLESKGFTVQMVTRVGADVMGSCGVFISDDRISQEFKDKTND